MSLTERALVAATAALAATLVAARLAGRVGLLDHPSPRKLHRAPVPLAGGVGVAVGVTLALHGAVGTSPLLAGMWALVVLGVLDDARDLRARTRLAGQAAAVAPAVFAYTPSLGAPRLFELSLALLWVLGVISAANCIDCADGVAASVAIGGGIALGALGGWAGTAGLLGIALAGAAAGFLLLNAPPARCFLGEAGSTVLGFLLAMAGLSAASAVPAERVLPVAVAGATVVAVPVLDFALVHARRARAGMRRPADLMASAGTDHLPHRLAAAGLAPRYVAAVCGGATAISGITATAASQAGAAGVVGAALGIAGAFFAVEAAALRPRTEQGARGFPPAPSAVLVRSSKAEEQWS